MENYQNDQNLNVLEPVETASPETQGASPASRKKQRMLLIAVLLCCAAIIASGTLAYFTAEETAYNVITTGSISMDLVEETTGGQPWPEGGISGVMPGMEVDKIPYVVNDGGIDFYARIAVNMTVTGANGNALSDKYISLNINKAHWTEKDGYYYYNGVVKPGQQTEPLFTKVTFDPDMHNAYMNATVEIDVMAEAVQSRNNGDSALEASGWAAAD